LKEIVPMTRLRRWSALAGLFLVICLFSGLRGQSPQPVEKKDEPQPDDKWLVDRTLAVSPAAAPVPALKYRLYPSTAERKDGNAVPMYLRFAHERRDARKKELQEKPQEWNKLPLEKLPLAEVKQFLAGYQYNLRQLELGARRKMADWSYSLDAGNPIEMLLPDAQEMRMHAQILVLKARAEIAEGRYPDAIRTLETGFSFSQQLGEGPFLISGLVGVAMANMFADCTLELMERPGAPNLYWALAMLPRPFVDLRHANELEQQMVEMQFPDLADLDRPRTPEQWDAALVRVRKEFERLNKLEATPGTEPKPLKPGTTSSDPAAKSPDLKAARMYLTEVVGMTEANVEAMPPSQVLLLYISHFYHDVRDDVFKGSYLPLPQGLVLDRESHKRLKSLPDTEAGRLALGYLPGIVNVHLAQARLERKLAALRVIEALRMHAAANGGELPDKLDQVKVVPVSEDPGTGKPFEYQRDGTTATLTSRVPGETLASTGLRYRVTGRK
jgi:hypothetical protein